MTRAETRRALAQSRDVLRARVTVAQARARDAVARSPLVVAQRRKRQLKRLAWLSVLLLLLLLIECPGQGQGTAQPVSVAEVVTPPVKAVPKKVKPRPPLTLPPRPVPRPAFDAPARLAPAWVDAFRLQVAARSPRLSQCFNGTSRPGALKWTTLVAMETGAVGNHEFEAVGAAAELTSTQLKCLEQVLSAPAYQLPDVNRDGLPQRVSLILEF